MEIMVVETEVELIVDDEELNEVEAEIVELGEIVEVEA